MMNGLAPVHHRLSLFDNPKAIGANPSGLTPIAKSVASLIGDCNDYKEQMKDNLFSAKKQTLLTSSKIGDSQINNQPPHIVSWHEGDYPEVFVYLSAAKYGFVWRAVEQGKLLERGIAILTKTEPQAYVEQQAYLSARAWIRGNIPNAQIRVRSALERSLLFDNKQIMEATRRIAA